MALANSKGKTGEREICAWVEKHLGPELQLTERVERNYNQASGGADVIIPNFIIEVKRRESLDLQSWWHQVITAKKHHKDGDQLIAVVAFRQNRKPWQFMVSAEFIGVERGFIILSEMVFTKFAKRVIKGFPFAQYSE